jgi:hypothetical protein
MPPEKRHRQTTGCVRALLVSLVLAGGLRDGRADFLDDANSKLSLTAFQGNLQLKLSGMLDLEGYYVDQPPPGLIFTDQHELFNPRLTLFFDGQLGSQVYAFVQARFDRGFDPSDDGAQARLDEYAVRVTPWQDVNLSVQAGKFATVIGNWVPRHYSWDNPFINAPLPYENLTGIWDSRAPNSVDTLLAWGHVPYEGTEYDEGYGDKYRRLPVIWGPSYASGISVTGGFEHLDYAFEVKNASLSSRPESWDLNQRGLTDPTVSGRVGFTPDAMWNVGISGSAGAYLNPDASVTLPAGQHVGDYREILLGQDVTFAWHRFQLWGEIFESRFEVPNIGNADALSYYLEAKYKVTAQLFAAARWNQQLYGSVRDDDDYVTWGNDAWRIDGAIGYRFTTYLQLKLQYSFTHFANDPGFGEQLIAAQLTIRF